MVTVRVILQFIVVCKLYQFETSYTSKQCLTINLAYKLIYMNTFNVHVGSRSVKMFYDVKQLTLSSLTPDYCECWYWP